MSAVLFDLDGTLFDHGAALARMTAAGAPRRELHRFVEPDPAARRAVETVARERDVALVSNGRREHQRAKLRAAGLHGLFEVVVISGEAGVAKPAPRIFEIALARLGCAPEDATFVGDDPATDIAGAAALGIRTVWVSRGRAFPAEAPPPDVVIGSIAELPSRLP